MVTIRASVRLGKGSGWIRTQNVEDLGNRLVRRRIPHRPKMIGKEIG